MSDLKTLTRDALDIGAGELVAGREADRVDEHIEVVPVFAQCLEEIVNLGVERDIQGIGHGRAEFGGHFLNAWFQLVVLIAKGELSAFTGEGLGNAPGDRTLACEPHDQSALSGHESHNLSPAILVRPSGRAPTHINRTLLEPVLTGDFRCPALRQLDWRVTSTYIVSFCPGCRYLALSMLFHRSRSATDMRKRLAIRYSESPLRTV